MAYDTSTTGRAALSSSAAATLGVAGAANPVRGAPAAAEPAGSNDRKIRDAWHERRRLFDTLKRLDTAHLNGHDQDAAREPYFQRIDACDATIMDTPADGVAGFAVKAQLAYTKHCEEAGNECGDHPPPDDAGPLRDDVVLVKLVRELQSHAGMEV